MNEDRVNDFLNALDNYVYCKIDNQIRMNEDSECRYDICTGEIERHRIVLGEIVSQLLEGKSQVISFYEQLMDKPIIIQYIKGTNIGKISGIVSAIYEIDMGIFLKLVDNNKGFVHFVPINNESMITTEKREENRDAKSENKKIVDQEKRRVKE